MNVRNTDIAAVFDEVVADELPGIGNGFAGHIGEILQRGTYVRLERLRASFPGGIADPQQVPERGPKRVHAIYHELGIGSLQPLTNDTRRLNRCPSPTRFERN